MIPSYLSPVANHLWQSTVFAVLIWLTTLALTKNGASVRCRLWLAASLKFVIPFSLLVTLGSQFSGLHERATEVLPPSQQIAFLGHASEPFVPRVVQTQKISGTDQMNVLPMIWTCGFAAVCFSWLGGWMRVRRSLRKATPLPIRAEIPILSSPESIEPGVFGIFRPVLILPEGIADRLTPAQFRAILAHEMCHVRRRDNLAAAIHMFVESIFWFHPLVWWIGTRLVAERERACDEEVLRLGSERQAYAEGILNVCKFYFESTVACVSGVTGSNLKKRIEQIMTNRVVHKLNFAKRFLLTAAGAAAVITPLAIGVMNGPLIRAQAQTGGLTFEVASVKHVPTKDTREMRLRFPEFLPGGKFSAIAPLQIIISSAYGLEFQSVRLSGGPNWIRSEEGVYAIDAKAEEETIPAGMTPSARNEKMRQMLQALLADRFKLVMRRETKEAPAYVLVVGKNGPKLTKSKIEEKDCDSASQSPGVRCHSVIGGMGRGLHGESLTISDLVSFVENWSDRPIVDKTGLTGLYNIQTDGWAPLRPRPPRNGEPTAEDIAMADPTRPTLFAIFEQLGLKLEAQKAPVETFVIESVQKPTEN